MDDYDYDLGLPFSATCIWLFSEGHGDPKTSKASLGLQMHKSILDLCLKFLCSVHFKYIYNNFNVQQVPKEH